MSSSEIFNLPNAGLRCPTSFHTVVKLIPGHDYGNLLLRLTKRLSKARLESQFVVLGSGIDRTPLSTISAGGEGKQDFNPLHYEPVGHGRDWMALIFYGPVPRDEPVPEACMAVCQYLLDEGYKASWDVRGKLYFKPKWGASVFDLENAELGNRHNFHLGVSSIPRHDYEGLVTRLAQRATDAGIGELYIPHSHGLDLKRLNRLAACEADGKVPTPARREERMGGKRWIGFMFRPLPGEDERGPEAFTTMCGFLLEEGYEASWNRGHINFA